MPRVPSPGPRVLVRGLLVAGFFAALTVVFFKPTVFDDGTFSTVGAVERVYFPWQVTHENGLPFYPQSDQAQSFYPRQVFVDRAVDEGRLPAWDPYTFAGHPYLANGGNSFFYPPRQLVIWATGPAIAHDLFLMLHMAVAGCTAYFLLRTLGASAPGSLVAGVAWMWNPFFLSWAQLELLPAVVAWLPLALALVHRAHHERSVPARLGAGATCGLMLLGASLDLAMAACAGVALYAAALEGQRLWRERRTPAVAARATRAAGRLAVLPLVAFGIGAPAVVPFGLLSARFARQPLDYDTFWSSVTVPMSTFARFFWRPDFPFTDATMHRMAFVGTPIAVLALVGVLLRRPGAGLGRGLLVVSILALGRTPLVAVLDALSASYRFLSLGRFMYGWALGLIVLATLGFDRVVEVVRRRWSSRALAPVLAAVVVLATGVQLFRYDRAINADFIPRDRDFLFPTTPAIDTVLARARGGALDRNLPILRPGLQPLPDSSIPLVFPFESGAGYESSLPSSIANLWRVVGGEPVDEVVRRDLSSGLVALFFTDRTRTDLLPRVGITSVLAPPNLEDEPGWDEAGRRARGLETIHDGPDADVLAVTDPLPRAYVVYDVEHEPDIDRALARFTAPGFDYRDTAILGDDSAAPASAATSQQAATAATVVEHELTSVVIQVDAEAAGHLVLLDSFDDGWSATVNGDAVDVLRANSVFRAVAVPEGRSTVVFHYTTPGLRLGLVLAGTTITVIGVVLLVSTRRARPEPGLP